MQEGLPKTKICPLDLGNKERQLQNSDLIMTYIIVGVGFAIATFIFIIEFLSAYFANTKPLKLEREKEKNNKMYHSNKIHNRKDYYGFDKVYNQRKFMEGDHSFNFATPPPYHTLFSPPFTYSSNGSKQIINGREYWVVKSIQGETILVPIRTPSALIFQYTD